MGRTACTEPQCRYKGDLYLFYLGYVPTCIQLNIDRHHRHAFDNSVTQNSSVLFTPTNIFKNQFISLRTGRSGDRIPLEGEVVPTRPDRYWAHPVSCTVGTVSFPVVKRPELCVDHTPTFRDEVNERLELYLYSPSLPSWSLLG